MSFIKTLLKRLVTLAIVGGAAYYGWTYYQATQAAAEEKGIGEIPTEAAAVKDITVSVSATGTLRPVRIIDVKSKAAGEIINMPVELGDRIRPGDLIAQIDIETLEQEMAQAQADLDSVQIRYDVTERQYGRAQDLQKQDLVSAQDLDTSEQNFTQARAQLLRAQAEIKLRQERLEDATVTAPSAGTVIAKNVEEGTIIQSSINSVQGGTTLVQMADLSTLEVRTLVDEIDIGRVRSGLPVEMTVEAFPDRKFSGTVIKIEPQAVIQQQVTTFPVLSRVGNADGLLLPGMNATVDVIIHRRPQVLTVPNEAVKTLSDAGQIAGLIGIPFDRDALRQGGTTNLAANAGSRADRGAAYADTPAQGEGAPSTAAPAGDGPEEDLSKLTTEQLQQRMREMPRDQVREFIGKLSEDQRTKLFASFRGGGGQSGRAGGGAAGSGFGGGGFGGTAGGGTPGGGGDTASRNTTGMDAFGIGRAPEQGVVFVLNADRQMVPRLVMTGVQDWENTEVVSGLRDGDEVVLLPSTSLLMSQKQLRDRFSSFNRLPGTGGRR